MITLYGITRSRAARCLWMLEELGIPYRRERVGYQDGSNRAPGYLAINPNGKLPALQDDGTVLFESLAINLYLAERYGRQAGPALWPASVADRGRCYQWSLWAMTELEPALLTALLHRAGLPEAQRNPEAAREAEARLQGPLAVLDSALGGALEGAPGGRAYLLGADFCVADLNVASVANWARRAQVTLEPFPALADWLTRCTARPAHQRVLADARAAS